MQTAMMSASATQLSEPDNLAPLLQEVAEQTALHGPNAPSTLEALRSLSLSYQFRGHWDRAEEIQLGIIATKARVLGDSHEETPTQ